MAFNNHGNWRRTKDRKSDSRQACLHRFDHKLSRVCVSARDSFETHELCKIRVFAGHLVSLGRV